jgi:hypothetical protein
MGVRTPGVFAFLIFLSLTLLSPLRCFAQYHDPDNDDDPEQTRDTANAFCIKLSKIILQTDVDYQNAKDSLMDSVGQKAWNCKEDFNMPGSRNCTIFKSGGKTTYVAFYLSRNTKDELGASYNNLYRQLRDCLGYNYVYTEKKTSGTDLLFGNKNYDVEMVPYGDGIPEQADIRVLVQKTSDGGYELILEMMKYTGYYTNRK